MNRTMQAAYIERYGGDEVVKVGPRPVPEPGPRQVLIEVHAAAVNPRDFLLREGRYVFKHLMLGFPKFVVTPVETARTRPSASVRARFAFPGLILGSDVSGRVAEVGSKVTRVRPGDRVVAMQTTFGQMGAFAEYMAVDEDAVALAPKTSDHAHTAGLPVAGLTALQALRDDAHLRGDERVAILGAAGGVGHYAVQIAKHLGARVVAVCSAANESWVRELGADEVIDYRSRDAVAALAESGRVDVVLDAIGKSGLARVRACLREGGRYITTVPNAANLRDALRSLSSSPSSRMVLCRPRGQDLEVLAAMVDAGALRTVIDSTYPLARTADALARSRTQRARGKIILSVR